jgi:hypothetical protein
LWNIVFADDAGMCYLGCRPYPHCKKNNNFSVSFSEGILGYDNELILRDGYEVVHHFTIEKSHFSWNAWNVLFGNRRRVDLSDEFEELVRSRNGEAIVNLRIKADEGMTFHYFLTGLLTLGLIAPNSVSVTIEGDVIRLNTTTAKQNDSIPYY